MIKFLLQETKPVLMLLLVDKNKIVTCLKIWRPSKEETSQRRCRHRSMERINRILVVILERFNMRYLSPFQQQILGQLVSDSQTWYLKQRLGEDFCSSQSVFFLRSICSPFSSILCPGNLVPSFIRLCFV